MFIKAKYLRKGETFEVSLQTWGEEAPCPTLAVHMWKGGGLVGFFTQNNNELLKKINSITIFKKREIIEVNIHTQHMIQKGFYYLFSWHLFCFFLIRRYKIWSQLCMPDFWSSHLLTGDLGQVTNSFRALIPSCVI